MPEEIGGRALDPSQRPGPLRVESTLGRGNVERTPLPGRPVPGVDEPDRFAERTMRAPLTAATVLVATIVVGQLWALTVALDAYLEGDTSAARWIVVFQAASFAVAVLIWLATPRRR